VGNVRIVIQVLEKDANINVASLAAQCLCALAQGLRRKFSPFVPLVSAA
jgi:hypothetical protein